MRLLTRMMTAATLAVAGCQSYSTPVAKTEGQMTPAELNARGDELIEQGKEQRLVGMSRGSGMQRHAGPNSATTIHQGEEMINHGLRLKAMAATRPA